MRGYIQTPRSLRNATEDVVRFWYPLLASGSWVVYGTNDVRGPYAFWSAVATNLDTRETAARFAKAHLYGRTYATLV